jgi:hypothetical protein
MDVLLNGFQCKKCYSYIFRHGANYASYNLTLKVANGIQTISASKSRDGGITFLQCWVLIESEDKINLSLNYYVNPGETYEENIKLIDRLLSLQAFI